jgi:ribosomal protein S18 acetylase RimI-like enzyme
VSDIVIRAIGADDYPVLEDLLYEAIYQPDPAHLAPREVIYDPCVYAYIKDFGSSSDDKGFVAELDGKIMGGAWSRILAAPVKGYGNIDPETPEFAIALFKEYRSRGIGTLLMQPLIRELKADGYARAALSVQKENYALRLYEKLGFEIVKADENEEDYIMVLDLGN